MSDYGTTVNHTLRCWHCGTETLTPKHTMETFRFYCSDECFLASLRNRAKLRNWAKLR